MESKTLPAHAIFDEQGDLTSIAVLNEKNRTTEFYQVTRMAFEDVGGFLKELIKPVQ